MALGELRLAVLGTDAEPTFDRIRRGGEGPVAPWRQH
jgi:hypothetical protein